MSIGAISLAGGLVLSAVNDLAIFHGCTTSDSCLVFFFSFFSFWLPLFEINLVQYVLVLSPNFTQEQIL